MSAYSSTPFVLSFFPLPRYYYLFLLSLVFGILSFLGACVSDVNLRLVAKMAA